MRLADYIDRELVRLAQAGSAAPARDLLDPACHAFVAARDTLVAHWPKNGPEPPPRTANTSTRCSYGRSVKIALWRGAPLGFRTRLSAPQFLTEIGSRRAEPRYIQPFGAGSLLAGLFTRADDLERILRLLERGRRRCYELLETSSRWLPETVK